MAELNVDFLRRRIDQLEAGGTQTPASPPPLAPAGKPPEMGAMSERLAKLEGAFDWIKVTVALIGAIMIFGFGFLAMQVTRI